MADVKNCFVIGPIGDEGSPERIHADWLLQGIIQPVFQTHFPDWRVERSDTIATPGMVSAQIINRLHDADLVIADLSFHNANAFYEMSLRHKVAKPIIHMIRKGERIPFDVIPHRAILFAHVHPNDHLTARDLLRAAVAEAIKDGFEADNPITHARGRAEFSDRASDPMKVLADEVATLRARLESVEISANTARFQAERALGIPPVVSPFELRTGFGTLAGPGGIVGLTAGSGDFRVTGSNAEGVTLSPMELAMREMKEKEGRK
ncbi:MAG TPA: hypothetical protein VKX28_31170 [Xanthobacteraceae bacterium]|nr:hypothetical protein [Xanthobacteraceae bacterium]